MVLILLLNSDLFRSPLITKRSTRQLPMKQSNIPTGEAKLHPGAPVTQTIRTVGWVVYQRGVSGP